MKKKKVSMRERTVSELTTELDKALYLTKSHHPIKKSESGANTETTALQLE